MVVTGGLAIGLATVLLFKKVLGDQVNVPPAGPAGLPPICVLPPWQISLSGPALANTSGVTVMLLVKVAEQPFLVTVKVMVWAVPTAAVLNCVVALVPVAV